MRLFLFFGLTLALSATAGGGCSIEYPYSLANIGAGKQTLRICSGAKPGAAGKKDQPIEVGALQIVLGADGDSPRTLLETPPYGRFRVERLGKDRARTTQIVDLPGVGTDGKKELEQTTYVCTTESCLPEKSECLLKLPRGLFPNATAEAKQWIAKKKRGDYSGVLGHLLMRALDGDSQAALLLESRRAYFYGNDGAEGEAETIDYIWSETRLHRCPALP